MLKRIILHDKPNHTPFSNTRKVKPFLLKRGRKTHEMDKHATRKLEIRSNQLPFHFPTEKHTPVKAQTLHRNRGPGAPPYLDGAEGEAAPPVEGERARARRRRPPRGPGGGGGGGRPERRGCCCRLHGPIRSLGRANLDAARANPGRARPGVAQLGISLSLSLSLSALRWLVGDWEIRWVRLGFLGARLYIGGGRPRGQSTRTETKQPSPCSSSRVLEQVAI